MWTQSAVGRLILETATRRPAVAKTIRRGASGTRYGRRQYRYRETRRSDLRLSETGPPVVPSSRCDSVHRLRYSVGGLPSSNDTRGLICAPLGKALIC